MGDAEVTVVPRGPPDGDQVARYVRAALAAEDNVMESGVFHVLAAHPTARAVALEHEVPNARWHQVQPLKFQLSIHTAQP